MIASPSATSEVVCSTFIALNNLQLYTYPNSFFFQRNAGISSQVTFYMETVSYTHLDVYKRQIYLSVVGVAPIVEGGVIQCRLYFVKDLTLTLES